eukprot:6988143-Ditylum_brightwellii.AAC.1
MATKDTLMLNNAYKIAAVKEKDGAFDVPILHDPLTPKDSKEYCGNDTSRSVSIKQEQDTLNENLNMQDDRIHNQPTTE